MTHRERVQKYLSYVLTCDGDADSHEGVTLLKEFDAVAQESA